MADTVKPKNLVPIHTFEGERYAEHFEAHNVRIVNDKEEVVV